MIPRQHFLLPPRRGVSFSLPILPSPYLSSLVLPLLIESRMLRDSFLSSLYFFSFFFLLLPLNPAYPCRGTIIPSSWGPYGKRPMEKQSTRKFPRSTAF